MTIKFKLLFTVLIIGLILIIGFEMCNPDRWAWVSYWSHDRIPDEDPNMKTYQQIEYYPGLDKSLLSTVKDNAIWLSNDFPAWQNMMTLLQENTQEEIEAHSFGRITYVQLRSQPNEFRGVIFTFRGTAMQCYRYPLPSKGEKLPADAVYQVVLSPDSSPTEPIIFNVIDLPEGFPVGKSFQPQRVEITGFFFKRWVYSSPSGILSAPLVLAKTINWTPAPSPITDRDIPAWKLLLIAAVAAFVIYWTINWYIQHTQPQRKAPEPFDLQAFNLMEADQNRSDKEPTITDNEKTGIGNTNTGHSTAENTESQPAE